jgi:hypothetical protein
MVCARAMTLALLLAACAALPAAGETTTERSSSILIFPKVVVDASRDTFIQISNTNNSMVHAHCFYVNAAPICIGTGDCLAGTCSGPCEASWVEVDFSIVLTKQQPTHWSANSGRNPDPLAVQCSEISIPPNYECDAAGLPGFPGRVPPVNSIPFVGELRCIEVDQSGAPLSGNHLKGEATIVSADGDASRYNAVGLLGEPFTNNGDEILCLGGGVTDECPTGAEYQGCAERLMFTHFAEGADSLLFGPTSTVHTELTMVPCRADFEHQIPTSVRVNFLAFNEFEQQFSTGTPVDCWRSVFLGDIGSIFQIPTAQTRFVQTHLRTSNQAISGIVGVFEEYHRRDDHQVRAAFNLHDQGSRPQTDLIFLPEGP